MEEDKKLGPFEWYKAKTIEEMRSDLMDMANGKYFDNDKQYAFLAGSELVVRTGEELNDQISEGYSAREVADFNEYTVAARYVKDIKSFVEYNKEVDGFNIQTDGKEFLNNYLDLLENMNQIVYFSNEPLTRDVIKKGLQFEDGMTYASEISTGLITDMQQIDYSIDDWYEWYLKDVAPYQAVLSEGQEQVEDLSIVGEAFFDGKVPPPNKRFPRKPEKSNDDITKLVPESGPSQPVDPDTGFPVDPKGTNPVLPATSDMFNEYYRPGRFAINPIEQPLKPEINPMQKGQDFIDIMADMRRINNKPKPKNKVVERRRFF